MYHRKEHAISLVSSQSTPTRFSVSFPRISTQEKMLRTLVCVCFLAAGIGGKPVDFDDRYQEMEEFIRIPQLNLDEMRHIEVDKLSSDALEVLCRNYKVTIHVKDTDSFVDCGESVENSMEVRLMKRDVSHTDLEMEGSGDPDTNETVTTIPETKEATLEETQSNTPVIAVAAPPAPPPEPAQELPEAHTESPKNFTSTPPSTTSKPIEETVQTELNPPVLFKEGFDGVLKNAPRNDSLLSEQETHAEVGKNEKILLKSPQVTAVDEVAKIGESKETPTTASPNSALMLLFGGLGIIGVLAFVFNYVKNRRDNKEIDQVLELEAEGRELKEMKPLMKSPLSQNGARSLEYIDADPQEEIVTELQTSEADRHSKE